MTLPNMNRTWRNMIYTVWDVFWIKSDMIKSTFFSKVSLLLQGCPFGNKFRTTGSCSFKVRSKGDIQIGDQVTLLAGWRSNRIGLSGMVLLQTLGNGKIKIGDRSGGSSVVISSRSTVTIGCNVLLGGNVKIIDHDFHPLDPLDRTLAMREQEAKIRSSSILIGDDVFVGTNATILKGVSIGDRAIIAAGAVVFKGEYPSGCTIAGNPATVIKYRTT